MRQKIVDQKREAIMVDIVRLGLRCEQYGAIWRVYGPGVDVKVADLSLLMPQDLKPVTLLSVPREG